MLWVLVDNSSCTKPNFQLKFDKYAKVPPKVDTVNGEKTVVI